MSSAVTLLPAARKAFYGLPRQTWLYAQGSKLRVTYNDDAADKTTAASDEHMGALETESNIES